MNFTDDRAPAKNFTGIVVVIVLHVLVAYGIISGLGKRMVTKMTDVVETKIIEEVKPPPPKEMPPPPPPPPMKAPPPPFIPPVEVTIAPPPVANTIAVSTSAKPATTELARPQAPPAPAPAPAPASVHVAAVADFNTCAKPPYPMAAMRNEETGTVTLKFLIGVDGRVVDSQVVKSSGSRDLDRAAQGGIGKCRFKPATTDGKPEQAWMQMQYVWTLD